MTDPLSEIAAAAEDAPEAPDLRPSKPEANRKVLDSYVLPPDCPIVPLGHLKMVLYFLDVDGQLVDLPPKLPKEHIVYLFRDSLAWLEEQPDLCAWKAAGKDASGKVRYEPDGFDQRKVQEALVRACGRKGFLDIAGKLRGRGSHRGPSGELILHCGDRLLIGGKRGARGQPKKPEWQEPGLIDPFIFPTGPRLAHPADKAATAEAGRALLSVLCLWNWHGSAKVAVEDDGAAMVPIEALMMLGWLGCAKLCGAIGWRPHIWLIGPSGAGKSTLQSLISRLLGGWALESQDPSEAWISQSLMDQRLPVLYDEPEPGEGEDSSGFVRKVIKLARLASSGGNRGRGSQDHKAVDFAIFSCFLFSSIMHHELEAQDRNRIAVLSLAKFPPDTAAMDSELRGIERVLDKRHGLRMSLAELGQALTRRLVEQWHRYSETLGVYQAELLRARVDPRGQNTYGELLAMADLMLFDVAPRDRMDVGDPNPQDEADTRARRLVAALAPLLAVAESETENVGERCLARLTSYRLTAAAGKHQETVGRWIAKALVEVLMGQDAGREARDKLVTHGLMLVHARPGLGKDGKPLVNTHRAYLDPKDQPIWLAVANKNSEALKQIFAGTIWKGGEWVQALGPNHVAGAMAEMPKPRFDAQTIRARLIPIDAVADVQAAREEAHRRRAEMMAGGG